MIFTTNKPLGAWQRVLHDCGLADAILDRVLERGPRIELRVRQVVANALGGSRNIIRSNLDPTAGSPHLERVGHGVRYAAIA